MLNKTRISTFTFENLENIKDEQFNFGFRTSLVGYCNEGIESVHSRVR